jgi:arginase family enzyme
MATRSGRRSRKAASIRTRTFMAGMRGTSYNKEDIDYGREKGVHIVEIEECMARGWTSVMEEARACRGRWGRPM